VNLGAAFTRRAKDDDSTSDKIDPATKIDDKVATTSLKHDDNRGIRTTPRGCRY
jgi:hypothetical protein